MDDKFDFLNPEHEHILTEQECELLTLFRAFTKFQRKSILNVIYSFAFQDKRLARIASKRKLEGVE